MANRATKKNLVDALRNRGYTANEATVAVNDVIDAFAELFTEGRDVSVSNFGTFRVVQALPRSVRNPMTGEAWVMGSETTVRWRPSPVLRAFLNGRTDRARLSVKAPKGEA